MKNKRAQLGVARFLIWLFLFVFFLGLVPLLSPGINFSLNSLNCSVDYTATCLIVDGAMPLMAISLLTMLVGYLKRSK